MGCIKTSWHGRQKADWIARFMPASCKRNTSVLCFITEALQTAACRSEGPPACFCTAQAKNDFFKSKEWRMWHMKTIWNSVFSIHKYKVLLENWFYCHAHSFTYYYLWLLLLYTGKVITDGVAYKAWTIYSLTLYRKSLPDCWLKIVFCAPLYWWQRSKSVLC